MSDQISKSELAQELSVTRACISQYVRDGLPVKENGKLDRQESLEWIARNRHGIPGVKRGANQARSILRSQFSNKIDAEDLICSPLLVRDLIQQLGPIVASVILEQNMSPREAFIVNEIVSISISKIAKRRFMLAGMEKYSDANLEYDPSKSKFYKTSRWKYLLKKYNHKYTTDDYQSAKHKLSGAVIFHKRCFDYMPNNNE